MERFVDGSDMIGKTITSISGMENGSSIIEIKFSDGSEYRIYTASDEYAEKEEGEVEIIEGDPSNLIGKKIKSYEQNDGYDEISTIKFISDDETVFLEAGCYGDPYGSPALVKRVKTPSEPLQLGAIEFSRELNAVHKSNLSFAKEVDICIELHSHYDWGEVDDNRWRENDRNMKDGRGATSRFNTSKGYIVIRTTVDRTKTMVVFEEELANAFFPEILNRK